MTDTECSYCGSINGGHTLACSALAQDAREGNAYLKKIGWERHQIPVKQELDPDRLREDRDERRRLDREDRPND